MTAFERRMFLIAGLGILGTVAFWGTIIYVVGHFITKFW